jgi:hypothetical protein
MKIYYKYSNIYYIFRPFFLLTHIPEDSHMSDRSMQDVLLRLYFHKLVYIYWF